MIKRTLAFGSVLLAAFLLFYSPQISANFSDIDESSSFQEAILYVQTNGIVSGYEDGTFRPNNEINRAEFTKIIIGATLEEDEIFGKNCFPDVKNQWFAKYVCTAKRKGIIAGYPDGTFLPGENISFAEAAKIISRGFEMSISTESEVWYEPFVEKLSENHVIPVTILDVSKKITRGEMVEMIWRTRENIQDLEYSEYVKNELVPAEIVTDVRKTYDEEYEVQIDFTDKEGDYKDLSGVMKSPLATMRDDTEIDLVDMYKKFGISEVRTNDDYVDNCEIYQDDEATEFGETEDYSEICKYDSIDKYSIAHHMTWRVKDPANIDNPDYYNFTKADRSMKMVDEAGAKIYLRLGESWLGPNDVESAEDSARVSANIYRHYIGEFGDIDFTPEISTVEIHNEGDGKMFWNGDDETFFALIKRTIERIRGISSDMIVGAPGFVSGVNQHFSGGMIMGEYRAPQAIVTDFITEIGRDNLDFFSAHFFGECDKAKLSDFVSWFELLQENLTDHGFANKPFHLTAWNIGTATKCHKKIENSDETIAFKVPHMFSFSTGLLLLAQEPSFKIDHAHFYAGHGDDMTLFGMVKGGRRDKKVIAGKALMAFYLHNKLKNSSLVDTVVYHDGHTSEYSLLDDLIVRGLKTSEGNYKIVLVNDSDKKVKVDLNLKNLIKPIKISNVTTYLPPEENINISLKNKATGRACRKENLCVVDEDEIDEYIENSINTESLSITSLAMGSKTTEVYLPPYSAVVVGLK